MRRALLVGSLLAVAIGVIAWVRYDHYWATTLDMGVFDQGAWLLSRGMTPYSTVIGKNLFADHLSPVLVIFGALYRLRATPAWLVGVQAAALGLTVVPMTLLAEHEGAPRWVGTLAVVVSAPIWAAGLFDFHPATLAVPALAWALLGARRDEPRMCLVAGLAVALCRVDLAWVLLGTAVVAQPRARRVLVTLGVVAVAAAVTVYATVGGRGTWYLHYGRLGSGPGDALLHPWRLVPAVLGVESLRALGAWLLPVGFLPLLRPRWLAAIVVAGFPFLVSASPDTHAPWFYYGALVAPLAIGGALVVIARSGRRMIAVGAIASVVAIATISPWAPRAPVPYRVWNVVRPPRRSFSAAVHLARATDVVAAGDRLLPHVDHRRRVWPLPVPFRDASPAGLAPRASPADARRVTIVLAEPGELRGLTLPGFHRVDSGVPGVVVLRR